MEQDKIGLIILGNGFDIFHNMKTKYSDFIKDEEISEKLKNNIIYTYLKREFEEKNWVDIEASIYNIMNQYVELKEKNSTLTGGEYVSKEYNGIISLLSYCGKVKYKSSTKNTIDYSKIKTSIEKKYLKNHMWNYDTIEEEIKRSFKEVKEDLKNYIKKQEVKIELDNQIKEVLDNYKDIVVLNYNYTNTIKYYNNNLNIIFIHGKVEDKIVFGHNNIDNEVFALAKKETQIMLNGENYHEKIKKYENYINGKYGELLIEIIVIGHSLDENDYQSILEGMESLHIGYNNLNEIKIFYHDEDDKVNKIYRMEKLIDKYNDKLYNELQKGAKIKFYSLYS